MDNIIAATGVVVIIMQVILGIVVGGLGLILMMIVLGYFLEVSCRVTDALFNWNIVDWAEEKIAFFHAPRVYGKANASGEVSNKDFPGTSFNVEEYEKLQFELAEESDSKDARGLMPFHCNPYKGGIQKKLYNKAFRSTVRKCQRAQRKEEAERQRVHDAQKDMFTAVKDNRKEYAHMQKKG